MREILRHRWWLTFVWLLIHSLYEKPIIVGECLIFTGLVYLDRKHLFRPIYEMQHIWRSNRHRQTPPKWEPHEKVNWKKEGF